MMRRIFQRVRRSPNHIRADVDDELRFHLEARTLELTGSGVPPDEARRQAEREFGDIDETRRALRSMDAETEARRRRRDFLGELAQDVTVALRRLRSAPGFTTTALLTLAVGIGANTAIFSVVNGVLLRPLPFSEPQQLVRIWWAARSGGDARMPVSAVDLDDWRAQRSSLADVTGYWYKRGASGIDLTGGAEAQRLATTFVAPGFFTTLRVNAERGRLPAESEMVRGGNDKVVVLSHGFWERAFGGSPGVIDSTLTLGGQPYVVLGVLPADFRFPDDGVDVYVPFSTIPDDAAPRTRPNRFLDAFGRMRPGVTVPQVRADMGALARRLASEFPDDSAFAGTTVESLQSVITGPVRASLLVLLGAVGLVLLLACVNLANLQLARGGARAREIAVRVSLGATRGRIVRQLLTESLVLAVAGGAAGILLGALGTRALLRLTAGELPRATDVAVDGRVLLFALAASVLTGLLFGIVPALRLSSTDVQETLREGTRGSASGNRLRTALVMGEIALAVVLASGASLMTRSFSRLLQVDPGFRSEGLVALNFTINATRWQGRDGYALFYHRVIDAARSLPGVQSAAAAQYAPFQGMGEPLSFLPEGMSPPANGQLPTASVQRVSDGWFATIGTPVLAGREFEPHDGPNTPLVVVINQTLARRYYPGGAVGKSFSLGSRDVARIIGVVGDIRQSAIEEEAPPLVYVDEMQTPRVKTTLVLRTRGDPIAAARVARDAIHRLDPDQPVTSVFTFDRILSDAVARPRMLTTILALFGLVAILLGSLGIYGVLAYAVSQRRGELGVRMALGASAAAVRAMIVRRGLLLSAAGVALGVPMALAFGRAIRGVLYGVGPTDPAALAGVVVLFIVVALAASWVPARRAGRVDPATVLRGD